MEGTRARWCALASAAALVLHLASASSSPPPLALEALPGAPLCAGGGRAAWWWRTPSGTPDADPLRWVLHVGSGVGWCASDASCAQAARAVPATPPPALRGRGVLSGDAAVSPALGAWSKAALPNCEGGPVAAGEVGAALDALQHELAAATHLLVTGCGGGGIAALAACDAAAARFPHADVRCAVDGAMLFDDGTQELVQELEALVAYHNATASLPAACVAAQPPGQAYRCMLAAEAAKHAKAPLLLVSGTYDTVLWPGRANCIGGWRKCGGDGPRHFRKALEASAEMATTAGPASAVLPACFEHCLMSQDDRAWVSLDVGGRSLGDAVAAWYGDEALSPGTVALDAAHGDQNPGCPKEEDPPIFGGRAPWWAFFTVLAAGTVCCCLVSCLAARTRRENRELTEEMRRRVQDGGTYQPIRPSTPPTM